MLTNSELKIWLIPNPSDGNQCYCRYCRKVVKASNQKNLHKHGKSPNHVDAVERTKGQVKLTDVRLKPSAASIKKKLDQDSRKLELALSVMCAKNHLPISLMDFLPPILKKFVPESAIVQNMKSGRTKTTGLIRNVIAPAGEEALVKTLQKQHFSITVDEATDRTTTKFMAIIVKYYSKERGKPVDEFFSIPVVTNATAEGLKDLVLEEFQKADIPLKNIIGFASDNCATMAGHIGDVAALLKLVIPCMVVMGCICQSFALCSAAALLPQLATSSIPVLLNSATNYTALLSAVRKDCTSFKNIKLPLM